MFCAPLAIYGCWQLPEYRAHWQTSSARRTDGCPLRLERTSKLGLLIYHSLNASFEMSIQATYCSSPVSVLPIFDDEIDLRGKTFPILRPQPLSHIFKWDDKYLGVFAA